MTWKQTERAIARRLNGKRLGATGTATVDVMTDRLAVEVKHRRELPGWLKDALAQGVAALDPCWTGGSAGVPHPERHESRTDRITSPAARR